MYVLKVTKFQLPTAVSAGSLTWPGYLASPSSCDLVEIQYFEFFIFVFIPLRNRNKPMQIAKSQWTL